MMPAKGLQHEPAPVLVLAVGNVLLRDDGVGLELLEGVRAEFESNPRVELMDGGTQGLALLPRLAGRRAMLVLDAIALGAEPGSIHMILDARAQRPGRSTTAHESNASQLIATAQLIGECPDLITVVGIEPAEVRTGVGLSEVVRGAVPEACKAARGCLVSLIERAENLACTK